MNTYKFAGLPSNSSVAALVTMVVSGWFLVAAGVLVAEAQPERAAQARQAQKPVAAAAVIAPEARMTIVVEARRSASL